MSIGFTYQYMRIRFPLSSSSCSSSQAGSAVKLRSGGAKVCTRGASIRPMRLSYTFRASSTTMPPAAARTLRAKPRT
eukprot:596517-Prorocentrum_minimum.AAC.1